MTLTGPSSGGDEVVRLNLEGRALIEGREVVRPAVPAEDMMQAFAYRHLVPARELLVSLRGNGRFMPRNVGQVVGATPVKIPAGGIARVEISTPTRAFVDRWELALDEPPDGMVLQNVSASDAGAELVLKTDGSKLKPGLKGNLIVSLVPGRNSGAGQKGKKQANQRRSPVGVLPAIPYEIVE